jgi:hypothetical protein
VEQEGIDPSLLFDGDRVYFTSNVMVAEGGTEYGHMITYARSKNPFGPFEGFSGNPVLTNRNLGGNQSLIQGIGHGDLIEDETGNYDIVCLGFRQSEFVTELSVTVGGNAAEAGFSFYMDEDQHYDLALIWQGENRVFLGSARTKYLSSEVAGGFTGVVMGLYAIDGEGRWAEFKNLTWKQG